MTGFVPRDCLSCVDALNETYQDMFGTKHCFTDVKWSVVFSDSSVQRSAGLKRQVADQMKKAVHNLQSQLFEGERTACYVGDEGLVDVMPTSFGRENAAQLIAGNGKIKPDVYGRSYTFFIRPKGFERADHPVGLEENEDATSAKSKGGRTVTGRDAAIVYWVRYPAGHEKEKVYFQAALDEVNKHLKRLDLPEVRESTLRKYVKALTPAKNN